MKIRAIVTGATGMVGEGVLHECLLHPDVEKVLVVGRRPCGVAHAKLEEIIHADFSDPAGLESRVSGYNACFFCLGVSSVGMSEVEYSRMTYELTIGFALILAGLNKDMVFCYVSGSGTDSTENGRTMWARVKGKTENALLRVPFRRAYMFRPGYMHPTKGLKNTLKMVKAVSWLYPLLRPVFPHFMCTLAQVGQAMIKSVHGGPDKSVLEVKDIVALAAG